MRRFGLLAMLAAWVAYSLTTVVPVSFTSWYAGRTLVAYGTIVASFNVEDFSLDRMKQIGRSDIESRMADYRRMLSF